MTQHDDPGTTDDPGAATVIRAEKLAMLSDMMALVRHRLFRSPAEHRSNSAGRSPAVIERGRQTSGTGPEAGWESTGEFVQVRL